MTKWISEHKTEAISYSISALLIVLITVKLIDYHRSPPEKQLRDDQIRQIQSEEFNIVLGNKEAPITMVMYYNYSCNSCRLFMSQTFLSVKREYIDKGLVYAILKPVEFSNNEISRLNLQALLCMDKMDLFMQMNEYLLLSHKTHESVENTMNDFANLNNELLQCVTNIEGIMQIESNNRQLRSINMLSTPTIIINNKIYKGSFPYVAFQRILEREIK